MVAMEVARQTVGSEQVLLGNLDPVRAILNGTPETIRAGFAQCYQEAGSHYIVGAGCEIPRGTPLENFRAIVDYAHTTPGGRA
jgi:uroporphyrinogen-III decarboxylase